MVPQATFKNAAGADTDPTNLTVKQQAPDGTESTLYSGATSALNAGTSPVAKTATGIYQLNPGAAATMAGWYAFNFAGTGAVQASEEFLYVADPSEFTADSGISDRALVTLSEARDWLQHSQQEMPEGNEIVRVINDVSDRIHYEAAREFKVAGANPQVRIFAVPSVSSPDPWYIDGEYIGDRNIWSRTVHIGDLATIPTLVEVIDRDWTTVLETVAAGDVTAHPINREPWEPIQALELHSDVAALSSGMRLRVTGTWGFPEVPGNIRQAALDAIASVLDRDVESYSTDLGPMQQQGEGTNVIIMGRSPRLLSLPPAALAVALSYRPKFIA
jgi:hypothetical protein